MELTTLELGEAATAPVRRGPAALTVGTRKPTDIKIGSATSTRAIGRIIIQSLASTPIRLPCSADPGSRHGNESKQAGRKPQPIG
jgi:hypothetical protein